jgi:hypothetical protein
VRFASDRDAAMSVSEGFGLQKQPSGPCEVSVASAAEEHLRMVKPGAGQE